MLVNDYTSINEGHVVKSGAFTSKALYLQRKIAFPFWVSLNERKFSTLKFAGGGERIQIDSPSNCLHQSNWNINCLLMYLRRMPSKFLGANLPLINNLCCPSKEPLMPISASKNVITCSGCLCILKIKHKDYDSSTIKITSG